MKKTIPITIAGVLFYIEEDAYAKLSEYLESVKAHFAGYPDSGEIVADIESRIAEQFTQNGGKEKIVTAENVEKLISVMGQAEDFGDEQAHAKTAGSHETFQESVKKRLYRNPDDSLIAGVASGIAAYLGIDPAIVRIIFVLVVLLGGSGILVYILLWIVMPEAKTNTEKLQMRGQAVTLESVNEMVKEKVEEVKKNKKHWSRFLAFPFIALGAILRGLFRITSAIIGFVVVVAAVFGMFWLVFVFTVTIFNIHSPYVDFPLSQVVSGPLFYLGLLALLFAALMPLLFLLFAGLSLKAKRSMFAAPASISLLVVWFCALITLGVVGSKVAPRYQNFVDTNPAYQQTTKTFDAANFQKVHVENDIHVEITEATSTQVSAEGRSKNLDELDLRTEGDTLTIGRSKHFSFCIFCIGGRATVHIQVPKLTEIQAQNSSQVRTGEFTEDTFKLTLQNASRAYLQLTAHTVTISQENGSYAQIFGSADQMTVDLQNASHLEAKNFAAKHAAVNTQNGSVAEVNVTESLSAVSKNASQIVYSGSPTVQQETKNGSSVHKIPASPSSTPEDVDSPDMIPELQ